MNYSTTTRRNRTTTWKHKTQTEGSMTQMLMATERTMPQRTSPLAWHCTTERAPVVLFLAHFITLTLAQVESCPHFTSISMPYTWVVVSLWLNLLHSLLSSIPPVCLPFPLLPPQRRAAAGVQQQEDHGKPVRLHQQRGWGHLRRPLPPHISRVHRVAFDWLFDRINLNPVHRHQKPTYWHPSKRKLHTWRMGSSVVFVQY